MAALTCQWWGGGIGKRFRDAKELRRSLPRITGGLRLDVSEKPKRTPTPRVTRHVPHSRAPKLAQVKINGIGEKLTLVLLLLVSVLHLGNHSTTRRETAPGNIHLKVRFPGILVSCQSEETPVPQSQRQTPSGPPPAAASAQGPHPVGSYQGPLRADPTAHRAGIQLLHGFL